MRYAFIYCVQVKLWRCGCHSLTSIAALCSGGCSVWEMDQHTTQQVRHADRTVPRECWKGEQWKVLYSHDVLIISYKLYWAAILVYSLFFFTECHWQYQLYISIVKITIEATISLYANMATGFHFLVRWCCHVKSGAAGTTSQLQSAIISFCIGYSTWYTWEQIECDFAICVT